MIETSFAQLLRVVQINLPPSHELYHLKAETVLLTHIVTCNATQINNGHWEYSTMGKTHFIDLNLVQCSVGWILDCGKWKFVDRSGPTAHIEIASPATSSQSSITDISTSDGFESDTSSSEPTGMAQDDPTSQQSPRHDEDVMLTSSSSESDWL